MDTNGTNMYMPVAPAYGNGGFFGGDMGGGWWVILLVLLMGGGLWGGYGGAGNGASLYPWMNQADITTSGFQNQMLGSQLSGLQSAVTGGFGDLQTALCGGFAGVNSNIANGFAQSEIAANARQIADMQQNFASQTATLQGFNGLQSQLAQCCCDNRLATANLQSVIQAENCADRAALSDGIRDVLVANNANTQRILDTMCQDKIDAKNEKIAELNNKINALEANNYVQNALTAQTQYFLSLYTPTRDVTPATGA